MRVAALVLAAGAGSRFGGGKMLAALDGRPVLQHVLDAVAAIQPEMTLVVLGHDADVIEGAIAWRSESRVLNPDPERGLASSLQVGIMGLETADPDDALEAALVFLGDQPLVREEVMRALLDAAAISDLPYVVPHYEDDSNPNPVVVRREVWGAAGSLTGDRGLGPLIAAHPDLRLEVPVVGTNPDVDDPADLEALRSS